MGNENIFFFHDYRCADYELTVFFSKCVLFLLFLYAVCVGTPGLAGQFFF